MKLFTSRYANKDLAARTDLVKVGISIGAPRFKLGYEVNARVRALMPDSYMVTAVKNGRMTRERYEEAYANILNGIDLEFLSLHLEQISRDHGNRDLVLLCFEDLRKPGAWCHRTMAARWLEEHGMGKVEELEEVARDDAESNALHALTGE